MLRNRDCLVGKEVRQREKVEREADEDDKYTLKNKERRVQFWVVIPGVLIVVAELHQVIFLF